MVVEEEQEEVKVEQKVEVPKIPRLDLNEQFEIAAKEVRKLSEKPADEQLLTLYGFYK